MTDADCTTESATAPFEIIDPIIQHLQNTAKQVWLVSSPIVITIGTLGNLLTIWIFLRCPKLRSTSTSLYLIVLAVVDTLLLYIGLLRHYCIFKYNLDYRSVNNFLCKFGRFIVYFMVHFEAWILVNVTLERFAAVFIPHKVKQLFSKKRAALAIGITGCILFLFNVHFLWGSKIELTLKSKNLTSSSKTSSMTAILISVSVTFLVFTLPITIHMLLYSGEFYSTATELEYAQLEVEWAVVNIVYYLNNSTNFFLYCISGPSFRREFLALISRNRVQVMPDGSATHTVTVNA
ncbi:hypothetical protein CAPTEDRAFT_216026 [Capitella teleta]|uniref:G-protein coupled receptors family 1 profile domain-containing protein n=1 Tax=Capitella teleta TaxID=283909 RepID=R7TZX4_CAPTE|nr:hypothetical protein CAPTEDRAFT_216026 [Capitella teleta]|eukprot:ELT96495.1 hypothetical protein CAPTEDRAFT_216026 [Capitella teleta]